MMIIGKVGLIVTIYVAYLMRIIVIKKQFFDFANISFTNKRNWIFVLCFMFVPIIIGWSYPQVTDWFALIGAFSMTGLIVVVPSCMMANEYRKEKNWKWVGFVCLWGVPNGLLGLAATISVLIKMVNGG